MDAARATDSGAGVSWQDVQDACQAAIVEASGLRPERVQWGFQNADAPSLDYAALSIGRIKNHGIDYVRSAPPAAGAPVGADKQLTVGGTRVFPLQVSVFTVSTADGNAAVFVADRIKSCLVLPRVRNILTALGISPFDAQDVVYAPDVVGIGFRGRAVLTILCAVPPQFYVDYGTYIARVIGGITTTDPDETTPYDTGAT